MEKIILFGDSHLESNKEPDGSYLLLKKVVQYHKPDLLIIGGDLLDFSYISKFSEGVPGLSEGKRLKDDFDIFVKELKFFKKYSKQVIFLEGNHEGRLNSYLEKNPVLKGIISLRDTSIELNINYIPTNEQPYKVFDNLYISHGLCYNEYFASKSVKSVDENIVVFHTHRTQSYTIAYPNGKTITCYGLGCVTNVNPDYLAGKKISNHSRSFGFMNRDPETNNFQFNSIMINNNTCIIGNSIFKI